MGTLTRSLWLPIGAANFFSPLTDPELLISDQEGLTGECVSERIDRADYVPFLRESVFRRLIEVLPRSFGYDRVGRCAYSLEQDDRSRPWRLTMTLRVDSAHVDLFRARPAHDRLAEFGVETVTLRVEEHGFYTFVASHRDVANADDVSSALQEHMVQIFGGDFEVNRLNPSPDRRGVEGAGAVRRYNGLAGDIDDVPTPWGALSFYQLNILIEALCNQSLLPAVFFERYAEAEQWLDDHRRQTSVVTHLDDFIREITVGTDATSPVGQMTTLHRFMMISRGTLQWMRRSVESVRRSLLDQMMAVSHRQARLIQLDLAGADYERTPEMTGDATESQMRGYVMLIATKLPLMATIADGARTATAAVQLHIDQLAMGDEPEDDVAGRLMDLYGLVESWSALLDQLRANVSSLEVAVEHDWQERLLYEQEQARSEQEAMAEIERSRRGRPENRRMGDAAYNSIMLLLTAVAVFVAVQAAETSTSTGTPFWRQAVELWPVVVVAVTFFFAWPAVAGVRRLMQQRKPNNDVYSFEFAFRLDERADQATVQEYLRRDQTITIRSGPFRKIRLRRLGGWRVERLSTDTTLVKVHSTAVVRLAPLRYARFEIVTEIMIRKISHTNQFFVRQCRMFGDSPAPLRPEQVIDIVRELLAHACRPLAIDFDLDAMTDPIELLRPGGPGHLNVLPIPHQRSTDTATRVGSDRGPVRR